MSRAHRPVVLWVWGIALVWIALMPAAHAASKFLPVDSAFSASAQRIDHSHIAVTWAIADGYYLYRHAFRFKFIDAGGHRASKPDIPAGNRHKDPFFGPVETYRHSVRAVIATADGAALPADARIGITYQGCADAGLCYPPQTRTLAITAARALSPATALASDPTSGSDAASVPSPAPTAPQDRLAWRLADAGSLSTLALFFGLGILLAFTPCILPMIPILSGIVVGARAGTARAFVLSLAYVLAMALAYTLFGILAGYFGANIQAALQTPAVLLPFALLFVALALASFGLFEIAVPGVWQTRLSAIGRGRGGLAGAALMGFFAALIAGPCLAPPLVGALLYISSSGNVALGGLALFMLGLGMGLPLILLATFGAGMLPKSGPWMDEIRTFFGVLLLAVALWVGARLADPATALAAWGVLALAYGAYLSSRNFAGAAGKTLQRATVFALAVYSGCAGVGLAIGGGRPGAPLAGLTPASALTAVAGGAPNPAPVFERVTRPQQLDRALATARREGRPVFVDFYADWCVDCVQMQHTVFADPQVRSALAGIAAIQIDVTAYDKSSRALMKRYNVFGPPAMLFYDRAGREVSDSRVVGSIDTAVFLKKLNENIGASRG